MRIKRWMLVVTKDLIGLIFVFRVMSLSFHTVDNLVMAAVACAILHTTSFFEPSSVIVAPRYLNDSTTLYFQNMPNFVNCHKSRMLLLAPSISRDHGWCALRSGLWVCWVDAAPARSFLRKRFSCQRFCLASSPALTISFVLARQHLRSAAVVSRLEGLK